ncbi:putative ABC transport system permease protein [Nitrosomonas cryotolerans]|uniref:Putative ABC transport system permease protein n=1 Tax=Nitrosomonas cryotolerans ATCC 49181 TaxID=1131553 RepID=A0A1N6HQF6_9PROT|nr:FtsX-like permease family protein [Nitrosomonas cryotolerans]SFQ05028.1 putative ABC transport system permease protein [Nitrosomonas cryotolerans]SIO22017.1 putative ABC transport system permease protein [Nitrosomonas cryotolerans ATCC 49181]
MRILWLDFLLALRNIVRQKRRSAIALGSIVFGIVALVLASGFIEFISWDFRESTIKSHLGHLQIVRPDYHAEGKANPNAFLLPDTIPEFDIPNEPPHITTITPRLSFSGLISYGESTLSFIGDGVDPEKQAVFENELLISSEENLSADNPMQIIIGTGLARNLGVNVGDQIVLLVNTVSGGINAIEVTIQGLFSTVTKSYDDNALRLPIETARQLLRTQGSHSWVILLADTAQTDVILTQLRNQLPPDKFEIVPWYELADFYHKTMALFAKQVQAIKVIIAFIILLSISNTMMISVMERIGEIGTIMALGVKRSGVIRLFLSEGILLGCIGGLLGLALSLLLAHIISDIGIPMPPPPGMSYGYTGEILVTQNIALESLILVVSTTIIASFYPAWKASRMQIVDALRHNR